MLRDPSLIPLSHQHHNGLALCVLTDRGLAADSTAASVQKLAQRIIDRYEIELINHFELEEQLLFPSSPGPLVDQLTAEHRQLETLVEQLRTEPSPDLLSHFIQLLRTHIRREENDLFPAIQRDLPRPQLDSIGQEIAKKAVQVCL